MSDRGAGDVVGDGRGSSGIGIQHINVEELGTSFGGDFDLAG
ncbi:hypothetical protein [Dictyobacter kobayashii]|nr:hypothetical protein [Dictyobacter kobayashii]